MKLPLLSKKLPSLREAARDLRFTGDILRGRPFDVLMQVTNRCNLRCSFCDFWPNPAPKHQELTVAEYARLADELAELGTCFISIEGGEPFVRDDIIDIVRVLSRRHITGLFTSGWHVGRAEATALWEAGLTHAYVSIDYPDAERHDAKRGLASTSERAWAAVDLLRDTAPRGGLQVNVMTVLMKDNWRDMRALLEQTAARGVGHQVTLLSTTGTRRSGNPVDELPPLGTGSHLLALFDEFSHLRFFRSYFEQLDPFLSGGPMPTCRAGAQAFNIDHVGNVASCIERIGEPVGNVREAPLADLHARLVAQLEVVAGCQDCWTACRGMVQALGSGGTPSAWRDLARRTRSY